jgi:hypothetical protein
VHARGRLLGDAADRRPELGVPAGLRLVGLGDRLVEDFFLFVGGLGDQRRILLGPRAEMNQQGGVAAIIEDHVGFAAVGPFEDLVGVIPVFLEALALDGKHRRARLGDGRSSMVLRRIDVARGPAHVGA